MTALLEDLRHGSRAIRTRLGLVTVGVLTLGLGIATSTTLYALFLPQLYEMPPVRDPDRLSLLFKVNPILGIERGRPTYDEVIEWRAASRAFEQVAAIGEGEATITVGGDTRRVSTHRVSAEFFETIGVKSALGRAFLPDDTSPVEKPVTLAPAFPSTRSPATWSRRGRCETKRAGSVIASICSGKPEALLHHSDQGSQYASEQFQRLLADHGITCSMSRAGDVWDNSAMESSFSSLKIGRVNRGVYATREEAKADVFDYIERFYNPTRRHSTLGYVSPVQFEEASKA